MSLFRDTTARSTLNNTQSNRKSSASATTATTLREQIHGRDPTYYDVLKCKGEFSTPSAFFSRNLKPAHSSERPYPWASQPTDIALGIDSDKVGNKYRLRRTAQSFSSGSDKQTESLAPSSSVFPTHMENALPPSVFRLPTTRTAADAAESDPREPWVLSGMTSGGRALRRANQATLSRFDRRVKLV
ncbi:hypothetical protein COEREDRAFT_80888 [Coemansia reversa NRRL 1564]|uniref:Uncharacterized protein n=1 Tax=Coemansia reversa (strain ATCC 12441 / NRRL 1564) TaxID=763665 RepID=A0A2G5BCS6_COERN|nr:hypothetical protein COEREDRAFT_80888 [Coemansia reversa NRRL 1564]|eukprot:PIA16815.1 hypothetical protein COEREDRAFT_80888 [Coemansia reversa NRRL 1564]